MNKKSKIKLLIIGVSTCVVIFSLKLISHNLSNETNENTKYIGAYYKNEIMGYRKVVEVKKISKVFEQIGSLLPYRAIGDIPFLVKVDSSIEIIENETAVTASVSQGFIQIIREIALSKDTTKIGQSNLEPTPWHAYLGLNYLANPVNKKSVNMTINFEEAPISKLLAEFGRVAECIKIEISSSYIEEQNIFGNWFKIGNEVKKEYVAYYYLNDFFTFVYSDRTFGDINSGIKKLNESFE